MIDHISGYHIKELLHESNNSLVYRAQQESDKQAVIVKMLSSDYPPPEKIAWFKREYEVMRDLNLTGVPAVISYESKQNRWLIVMSDFGGDSLRRLEVAGTLTVTDFLALAIKVSEILGQIHAKHIMHKDINPANIVLNSSTGQVKIIDFGISTVLERENPTFKNPSVLEGTLLYISPEQTGRMNRAMDYRTDFYSLGVTFYELLTGQLPFESSDPLALVHAQMARQPIPPHELNPKLPPILSNIILKLMAKNAEDRYQSAYGLKYDLEQLARYPSTSSGSANPSTFELATHDFSGRFQIPQKLYGREEEIKSLLTSFERVSEGAKELVLVEGYSGVGKSALVNEVHKPITAKRGYFIRGKFDQLQRGTPLTAFTQAFNEFCNYLLTENEAELEVWQARILSAVGNNGRVLTDVIPNLEQVIGPQPPVSRVGPQEAENRFKLYFQFFIRALSLPENPLVIFIDDWQWADRASLNLLELLMTDTENQHLLVIAAYRDNEVGAGHPFRLTLDGLEASRIQTIQVHNLSQTDITALLEETFGQRKSFDPLAESEERITALARLIHEKTAGNAFFTHQLLQTLYNENLLRFDPEKRAWDWDMQQIERQGLSDNVVDLMTGQLVKLPSATQHVIRLAACIGNRFNLQTLATIYEQSEMTTAADLASALQQRVITPLSNEYKLVAHQAEENSQQSFSANIEYRFVHDRVHQAAYLLIPDEQKQAVHLQIGRLLLAGVANEQRGELHENPSSTLQAEIFEIANHHNLGMSLIEAPAEKVTLARLNLLAGEKANSAFASQAALTYFKISIQLLSQKAWTTFYDLSLRLYNNGIRAAYFCREFTQMDAFIDQILQYARTPLECLYVYQIRTATYAGLQNFPAAVQSGLQGLQQLGLQLPSEPTYQDVLLALRATYGLLHGKTTQDLLQHHKMTAPDQMAVLLLLGDVSSITFLTHSNLSALMILKMIELSLRYGNSPVSPHAYLFYGIILCGLGDIDGGKRFGQLALDLLPESGDQALQCRVPFLYNYWIAHWKKHVRKASEELLDAYAVGIEVGELNTSALILASYGMNLVLVGEALDQVEQWIAAYAPQLANTRQYLALGWLTTPWQVVLNLMGKTEHRLELLGPAYHEVEMLPKMQHANDKMGLFGYHVNKMWLAYLFYEHELAIKHAANAQQYSISGIAFLAMGCYHLYAPLSKLHHFHQVDEQTQHAYRREISQAAAKLQMAAKHAPMNYLHKWHLVEAERARVFGDESKARKHYETAIKLAHENQYLHEEALAYELAGKFYLSLEMPKVAQLYLRDAHYAYERWGAIAKVAHLEERYPFLAQVRVLPPPVTGAITTTGSGANSHLDLTSVLKASQTISGEIHLPKLLDNLMRIVLENAGAEKGCLLLPERGSYQVAVGAKFTENTPLPEAIINYVVRSHKNVVLNDATHEGLFTQDDYIQSLKPKSVLCAPLINQGRLTAILYLENNLITGAFTPERLEILNLLSSQAAISIENATLVNTLEQKVAERTREAEKARLVAEDARRAAEDAHRAAEDARRAAEDANQAKSRFLANMSHELRTPLNAILGFSQIIRRSHTVPKEHIESLGIISRSGEHLLTLINNVLDLSKIEAGKTTLNMQNFDLYRLLDDLEDMFQLLATEKRLQLIFEYAPHQPRYIRTDSVKLRQVLINLLSNAIKFTAQGHVSVSVTAKDLFSETTTLCFEISDTGAGIAPEEQENLFEAFVQTETGKSQQEGTGLGLPISRQFVKLMGGDMRVQSDVGQGTTFTFDIQVTIAQAPETQEALSARRVIALAPNQPPYRILIVDDKAINRQLLINLLKPLGFEVAEASNGQEAITAWQQWQPDLIWMDIRMPLMDGYEAIKTIKQSENACPIIALTASIYEEEEAATLEAGGDDFLRKPFRSEQIVALMSKHLGVRYIYENDTPSTLRHAHRGASSGYATLQETATKKSAKAKQSLTSTALSNLPPQWRLRFHQATIDLNLRRMLAEIAQIRPTNEPLADALTELVHSFQFETLASLLEDANEAATAIPA